MQPIEIYEIWNNPKNKTRLWVSKNVENFLNKKNTKEDIYDSEIDKLKYMLLNGFSDFISSHGRIRIEWGGIYRIEVKKGYRLIGYFYHEYEEFHALEYYSKKRTSLSKTDRQVIDKVAKIKNEVGFKKIFKDERWNQKKKIL